MAVVGLQQLSYVAIGAGRDRLSSLAPISFRPGDLNLFLSGSRLHKASIQILIQTGPHSERWEFQAEPPSGTTGC